MKIIIEETENVYSMDVKSKDATSAKVAKMMMVMTVEAIVKPMKKGLTDETVQEIAEQFGTAMADTIVELYKKRQHAARAGLNDKEAAFLQALQHKAGREN